MAGKMRDVLAVAAVLVLAASASASAHEPKAAAFAIAHQRVPSSIQADFGQPKPTAYAIASQVKPVAASIDDVVQQTKLGAQFLKTAVQLTKMLSAEQQTKMKDDTMMETTHDIVGYAKTLMASMGHAPATPPASSAQPSSDFWTLRRSHPKSRPICTVTSGYWGRECECEFLPKKNKKPQRPKPDEDDEDDDCDDDDDDNDHTKKPLERPQKPPPPSPKPKPPPRPDYPWNHEHYYPQPEYARPPEYYPHEQYYPQYSRPEQPHHHNHRPERPEEVEDVVDRVERLVQRLGSLLEILSEHIEDIHRYPGSHYNDLRTEQRLQLIKVPLATVGKLKTIMKNQKLVDSVKSSGGPTLERFLKEKVADVEAMVTYPDYLNNQMGKLGASQPLVAQVQAIIDKLEPLTH